ncbi:MAG TPA: hypothetical protein VIT91_21475 [Chthoniobacterales bacterium]
MIHWIEAWEGEPESYVSAISLASFFTSFDGQGTILLGDLAAFILCDRRKEFVEGMILCGSSVCDLSARISSCVSDAAIVVGSVLILISR